MYQPRIDQHGNPCCTHINSDGSRGYGLRAPSGELTACDACRVHHAAATDGVPDPYARDLAALRAAAPVASQFERDYMAARIEALAEEHADNADTFTTLAADDLAEFEYLIALERAKR